MENKEIITTPSSEIQELAEPSQSIRGLSPIAQMAMSENVDVAKLEKLFEIEQAFEASQARKQFHKSLASFKSEAPMIEKNKKGHNSQYAGLGYALGIVSPVLSKHGLSLTFKTEQGQGLITVTAILTHFLGHSESTSLTSGAETSGSKNAIQALGSAVTYLERYTAFSILGLASIDDDDGQAVSNSIEKDVLSMDQIDQLKGLIAGKAIEQKREPKEFEKAFLTAYKYESLGSIPAIHFEKACGRFK